MDNKEIRAKLIELSDAKYKEFHSGLCQEWIQKCWE